MSDPCWKRVLEGVVPFQPTSLVSQILFTCLSTNIEVDPSASNVERCIREFRAYFEKNERIAIADLAQITR